MILHVVERALRLTPDVVVATDDERIQSVVVQQGYEAIMTSGVHTSGTSRCIHFRGSHSLAHRCL